MLNQIDAVLDFDGEFVPANLKTAMAAAGAKSRDLWQVPLKDLKVLPGFNPRIKDEAYGVRVRRIADSMKENGFFQDKPLAIVVTEDGIFVVEGGTRYDGVMLAASEGAAITTAPCVVKDRSCGIEDLTVALVQGNDGERFSPYELSVVVKRLAKFGNDEDAIAVKLGLGKKYVQNLKVLASAPFAVRKLVQDGLIAANLAIDLVNQHGANATQVIESMLDKAKGNGKVKATLKDKPGQARASYFKKSAPRAFEAIEKISAHPAYAAFPDDLKELVKNLLEKAPAGA